MTFTSLSESELVACLSDTLLGEREELVRSLSLIAELDRRKLTFEYPSLRKYLVEEHGLEEWNAERRIRSARLIRRFPFILTELESGKLNLTLLELAMGCASREGLGEEDYAELLKGLSGQSCQGARREIAARYGQRAEIPKDRIRPLTEDLSEVRFVADQELLEKLEDIRGLLLHSHPGINLGEMIKLLATEYRERHHPEAKAERARIKRESSMEPTAPWAEGEETRRPTQAMLHELIRTRGYRCSYPGCTEKRGLEVDHIVPWSCGGKTTPSNLRYLCPGHHKRVSFLRFGESSKHFHPRP